MNFSFIKTLTLSLLLLGMSKLIAQPFVSINNATISVAPSYTFAHGTNYTVSGSVVNSGTTTINSNVHVHLAIDTSSFFGVNKFYTRSSSTYPMVGFLPNNTFTFNVGDVATQANNYKVAGNGITIVIWATAGSNPNNNTTTKDSVFSHIYVLPPVQSIEDEKSFEENAVTVQNPAKSILEFRMQNSEFKTIELINANGTLLYHETTEPDIQNLSTDSYRYNISHLKEGIYYLQFTNKSKNKTLTKKIIILN